MKNKHELDSGLRVEKDEFYGGWAVTESREILKRFDTETEARAYFNQLLGLGV